MELGHSRLDLSVSGQAQVAGSFENGREPSGYIKRLKVLDLLRNK